MADKDWAWVPKGIPETFDYEETPSRTILRIGGKKGVKAASWKTAKRRMAAATGIDNSDDSTKAARFRWYRLHYPPLAVMQQVQALLMAQGSADAIASSDLPPPTQGVEIPPPPEPKPPAEPAPASSTESEDSSESDPAEDAKERRSELLVLTYEEAAKRFNQETFSVSYCWASIYGDAVRKGEVCREQAPHPLAYDLAMLRSEDRKAFLTLGANKVEKWADDAERARESAAAKQQAKIDDNRELHQTFDRVRAQLTKPAHA